MFLSLLYILINLSSRICSVTGFDSHYSLPPSPSPSFYPHPTPFHNLSIFFHFYAGFRTKIYPVLVIVVHDVLCVKYQILTFIYTFYCYYYYVVDRELYHTSAITSCSLLH